MIQVICRDEAYIYNAYHMTKAFYPSAEVVSRVEEKASNYVTVILDGKAVASVPDEREKEQKRRIDIILYRQLAERTGRTLSWGILTGVRPVKLAVKRLDEGMTKEEFIRWFG